MAQSAKWSVCRYPGCSFVVRVAVETVNHNAKGPADAGKRLVGVGGLLPSGRGARARLAKGKVTVTDGPFPEAKEVVGGFAIYDVPSLAEAKEWTRRFLDLHVKHFPGWDCEVEIREMME